MKAEPNIVIVEVNWLTCRGCKIEGKGDGKIVTASEVIDFLEVKLSITCRERSEEEKISVKCGRRQYNLLELATDDGRRSSTGGSAVVLARHTERPSTKSSPEMVKMVSASAEVEEGEEEIRTGGTTTVRLTVEPNETPPSGE